MKQITVKSLCELADINRGTFYAHYSDIYDLVEKLEEDLIENTNNLIQFEHIGETDQLQKFVEIFSHIKTNIEDYQILLLNPESSPCLDVILAEVYKYHAAVLINRAQPLSQTMIDYTFALLASGCTKVILKWIDNDFAESPQEMAVLVNTFAHCGIASIAGEMNR